MLIQSSPLTYIDMGISMFHWDLICEDVGVHGSWKFVETPKLAQPSTAVYVATWISN